ncbi:MAG: tetratricopeptide repeat protein, partial [Nitrospinota bacterium]
YRRLAAASAEEGLARYVVSLERADRCGGEEGREALRFILGALAGGAALSPGERLRLGGCLERAGMDAEALAQWEAAAKAAPAAGEGVWAALRQGALLERRGQGKEAMARYARAAEAALAFKGEKPQVADALQQAALRGAVLHFGEGDCPGALRLLKLLPREAVPDEARAEVASLRAECAFEAKQWGDAEVYFEQVLLGARRPELAARARVRLAAVAEAKGDGALAVSRLREALPLLPADLAAEAQLTAARLLRGMGDGQGARAMLVAFAQNPKGDLERRRGTWLFLARDAVQREAWKEAAEALEGLREIAPLESAEALSLQARVRWREGNCAGASRAAHQALNSGEAERDRVPLRRVLASCLLKEGRHAEAVPALEEIVRLEPGAADAAFELANALERAGEKTRAAEAYARFAERFPAEARAPLANLRLGYLRSGEGNREEAVRAFARAAQGAGGEAPASARYELARDLESQGKPDDALAAYEELIGPGALDAPAPRGAAWRAASILEAKGEWSRAAALYRRLAEGGAAPEAEGERHQALARAARIEEYLRQVREREERMKRQAPLFR